MELPPANRSDIESYEILGLSDKQKAIADRAVDAVIPKYASEERRNELRNEAGQLVAYVVWKIQKGETKVDRNEAGTIYTDVKQQLLTDYLGWHADNSVNRSWNPQGILSAGITQMPQKSRGKSTQPEQWPEDERGNPYEHPSEIADPSELAESQETLRKVMDEIAKACRDPQDTCVVLSMLFTSQRRLIGKRWEVVNFNTKAARSKRRRKGRSAGYHEQTGNKQAVARMTGLTVIDVRQRLDEIRARLPEWALEILNNAQLKVHLAVKEMNSPAGRREIRLGLPLRESLIPDGRSAADLRTVAP